MSVIALQVGQCGNQIGPVFFNALANEFKTNQEQYGGENCWAPFFHTNSERTQNRVLGLSARCVLIDMEPKVVNSALNCAKKDWKYGHNRSFVQASGSGNNWAMGYAKYGPKVQESCMELIRKEVECTDYLGGMLMFQSIGGGTGAGLGAHLCESIRDEYPSSFILNCCVWPYSSGEVVVQNYNSILTLSHLLESSDGIWVMENDTLHETCRRMHGIPQPSFNHMNQVGANVLTNALLPSSIGSHSEGGGKVHRGARLLGDYIDHLCSHPLYRIMSMYSIPQVPKHNLGFTTFKWTTMLKRLGKMLRVGAPLEEGLDWNSMPIYNEARNARSRVYSHHQSIRNKSVANMLVLRGRGGCQVNVDDFRDPDQYCTWNADPLLVATNQACVGGCTLSAALISNSQRAVLPVVGSKSKAWRMFRSRAYVHQYEQFGFGVSDFQAAFAKIDEVVANYEAL